MTRRRGLPRSFQLLLVAALASTPCRADAEAARRTAAAVEERAAAGDFDGAREAIEALDCGDDVACRTLRAFSRGYLYDRWAERDGDPAKLERAHAAYEEALETAPGNEQVRANLAALLARQGRLGAVRALMLEPLPDSRDAAAARLLFVGDLHARAGELQEALALYLRAAQRKPQSADAHRRILRVHRQERRPAELFAYCQALLALGLERSADHCLTLTIELAWETAPELAERALLRWTELRADRRLLAAPDLDRLPAGWKHPAVQELEKQLVSETPARDATSWWTRGPLAGHVLARVFQTRAAELRQRKQLREAAAWLTAAHEVAPDLYHYETGRALADRSPPKLDAMVDLAAVYNEAGEDEHVADLVRELFSGKSRAYLARESTAIGSYHTVLGLIFSEQQRWESDGYDNAIFQLDRAVAFATKSGSEPAPDLRMRLAEAYWETGKRDLAAPVFYQASMDYLNEADPYSARKALESSRAAGYDETKVASLEEVVRVAQYLDEGARLDLAPDGLVLTSAVDPSRAPVELADSFLLKPDPALDSDFLRRQRMQAMGKLTFEHDLAPVVMIFTRETPAFSGTWNGKIVSSQDLAQILVEETGGSAVLTNLYLEQDDGTLALIRADVRDRALCGRLLDLVGERAELAGEMMERDGVKMINVTHCKASS